MLHKRYSLNLYKFIKRDASSRQAGIPWAITVTDTQPNWTALLLSLSLIHI